MNRKISHYFYFSSIFNTQPFLFTLDQAFFNPTLVSESAHVGVFLIAFWMDPVSILKKQLTQWHASPPDTRGNIPTSPSHAWKGVSANSNLYPGRPRGPWMLMIRTITCLIYTLSLASNTDLPNGGNIIFDVPILNECFLIYLPSQDAYICCTNDITFFPNLTFESSANVW